MKRIRPHLPEIIRRFLISGACLIVFVTALAVFWSGRFYQFDTDEIFHLHAVYEISRGSIPYRSFFFPYAPVLEWFLLPVSNMTGFGTDSMAASRLVMIGFFAIRIAVSGYIGYLLSGIGGSLLLTLVTLADPFTSFAGMQIRPENPATTFLLLSVAFFLAGAKHQRQSTYFLFGCAAAIAILTCPKVFPAAIVLIMSALFTGKKSSAIRGVIAGLSVPTGLFFLYWICLGEMPAMLHGVWDGIRMSNLSSHTIFINNFYWPANWFLYGLPRETVLWYLELMIPIFGFAGILIPFFGDRPESRITAGVKAFAAAALIQGVSLFFVHSVFLQYFLPLNALLLPFFVLSVVRVIQRFAVFPPAARIACYIVLAGFLGLIVRSTVRLNVGRIGYGYDGQLSVFRTVWSSVPEKQPVFPGFFYRPNASYLGYGWNPGELPVDIRLRVLRDADQGVSPKVRYVYLPVQYQQYYEKLFGRSVISGFTNSGVSDLWVRP